MKLKTGLLNNIATICFIVIISAGYVNATGTIPSPKAVIDQITYVFSPVIAGTEVSHSFSIGNQGDAPLNIAGVQAG
jgi:hypothetical protein